MAIESMCVYAKDDMVVQLC